MSLEQAEKHALELLADGLRQRYGTALWRVSLFGSKARGDDHPSSDIDVLVVLREPVAENAKETVSAAAYDVLEKSGVYISTVVVSDREFRRPTGQLRWLVSFVQEDGITLWSKGVQLNSVPPLRVRYLPETLFRITRPNSCETRSAAGRTTTPSRTCAPPNAVAPSVTSCSFSRLNGPR